MSALQSNTKSEIIQRFRVSDNDCGSPEVQVALLTARIQQLTQHFAKHRDDKHSKRGMLKLISRRKKLLAYLREEAPTRYKEVIQTLGLRK
jgi:small subunit ribosomal protein S15